MKKSYKILIGIAVVLIIVRLILPYVVLKYANKKLTAIPGYYGHVDDIDISLYRGAYIIKDAYLNKLDSVSKKQTEFFKSPLLDLSVEWRALFHGRIVGELEFDYPELIFTKDKAEFNDVKKDTADFRKLLKDFMPLKVNRFEVKEGAIHYIDKSGKMPIDIALSHTHILALNLSNVTNKNIVLPSSVTAQAGAYEGTLNFNMKLDALAKAPTFDLNAEMKNTNLALLNTALKKYGNVDVNKGNFSVYMEMATKEGRFKGYVKPIIKDLDVVGPEDASDNILHKIWESIVGAAGVALKNQKKDQIATKVDIEGNLKNPKVHTLDAVMEILRNAFIQALVPKIDNEISINSLKGKKEGNIIKRIFASKDKDKKEKKHKKRQ
jgi:hypothetical protein